MKKVLLYTLCMVMLLTCFTACKQDAKPTTPESKTDVSTPAVVDQQPKEEVQAEADETDQEPTEDAVDKQVEDVVEDQEVAKEPTVSKPAKPAVQSKPEEQPIQNETVSTDTQQAAKDIHYDEAVDYPTFVSEDGFKVWLTKGSGLFEDERTNMLQQTNSQKFSYVHFSKNKIAEVLSLDYLSLDTPLQISYEYHFLNSPDSTLRLTVNSGTKDQLPGGYRLFAEYNTEPFCSKTIGVTQYNVYRLNQGDYLAYLLKDGIYHSVNISNYSGDVEQLLSQLVIEKVTINLNSDLVTE